jgi:hypothetical protein
MTTHVISAGVCPNCSEPFDRATNVGSSAAPGPGDVNLCFHCAAILRFDATMQLVLATDADLAELDASTLDEINHARSALLFGLRCSSLPLTAPKSGPPS